MFDRPSVLQHRKRRYQTEQSDACQTLHLGTESRTSIYGEVLSLHLRPWKVCNAVSLMSGWPTKESYTTLLRYVARTESERPCRRPRHGDFGTERLAEAGSTSSLPSPCSRTLWPIQAIAKQRPAVTILRYSLSTLKDVLGKRLLQVPRLGTRHPMIRAIWSKHGDAQVHDMLRLKVLSTTIENNSLYNPAIRPSLRSVIYCLPRTNSRIHAPERNLSDFGDLAFAWLVTGTSATRNDAREDCTRHERLLLVGRTACIRHGKR
jgi:hypothetical protein